MRLRYCVFFFFQAEDGIRYRLVTGVQTCALPIWKPWVPWPCAGDLRGLLMVALRSQGNWRWEGPLGTPLGLVHWKRASSPVEAWNSACLSRCSRGDRPLVERYLEPGGLFPTMHGRVTAPSC